MTATARRADRAAAAGGVALAVVLLAVALVVALAARSTGPAPAAQRRPYDPVLPPAPAAREHAVTIRAVNRVLEVAPGVPHRMWTFNGTVPGPVLRGRIGDVFTVTFVNDGRVGHSLDVQAGEMAPNRAMRTIAPGERLVYGFRAARAGAWLYYGRTPAVPQQTGNGMYGALIVDPPGLPPVDREYVLVQAELPAGPGTPDAVVFNGYPGSDDRVPLRARRGERVRLWVLDAGPSEPSAFHVVGAHFDTVFSEGGYLLRGGPGGAQTLALQPGEGGFVETTFAEPGRYPFLTHRRADAERGAHGHVDVR